MGEAKQRFVPGDACVDLCHMCRVERSHTVAIAAGDGIILRATCDECGAEHPYRGGGQLKHVGPAGARSSDKPGRSRMSPGARIEPFDIVSDRERSNVAVSDEDARGTDLELLFRRIVREELGATPVVPADKWRGGDLVLRPGAEDAQEKSWPIETFFSKVVMVRNRLRVLEQQINSADVPTELKIKLQSYITGCYGSLTSFNILFADADDRFVGASKKDDP